MTDGSTRAAGDSLEARIKKELPGILAGTGYEYRGDFGRKAMQDLEFFRGDSRYLVDVKSWRRGTIWGAPNLTSVARLADLYEDPNAFFTPLIVHYSVCDNILVNLDFQFLLIDVRPITFATGLAPSSFAIQIVDGPFHRYQIPV